MKEYKINEYGVCENPDTVIIFQAGPMKAKIHLASKNGQWAYGYDFEIKGARHGCFVAAGLPAFGKYRKKFTSREDARKAAIKIGIEYFTDASRYHNVSKVISALKNALTPQLSLPF